jgi:glycosyltransferase involved in cell wall biosynthesis
MRNEKITLACVTKPHLDRLKNLIPRSLPYVDRVVIVLGERDKETESYLLSLGPKVEVYFYKWHDNFAASWNAYLSKITQGWVLLVDDDEIPSDLLLKSLDRYVEASNYGNHYCCVEFQCNPVSEGQDMGPVNYWRQILFRRVPGMQYQGGTKTGCHQYLVGYQNNKFIRSDSVYYHIKSLKDEYRNASRNYFIYGIWLHGAQDGIQREEWFELKDTIDRCYPEVETFPDLDRKLIAGNVHQALKDWMIKWYNNLQEGSAYFSDNPLNEYWHYNEARALIVYYFKYLHPEEKPTEISL